MVTRSDFATGFLNGIGAPLTPENYLGVYAWIRSEFGDGQAPDTMPSYNPLATTQSGGDTGAWNSAGVKIYGTFADGVKANVDTLLQDHPGYAEILDAFRSQAGAYQIVNAINASAWGSHPNGAIVTYINGHDGGLQDAALSVGPEVPVEPAPPVPPVPTPGDYPRFPGTLLYNGISGHGTAVWQARMQERGWTIDVDDVFGPQTDGVCRAFQAEKGLQVDGVVGPVTWDAAWTAPIT